MLEMLAGIGRFILILFEVVLIFNLMIVVHEYGHFLAARWRGLKIEKFQIWFGKAILKKEINGVQWGLGTIPLGGFVALPQMAPMDAIEGRADDGDEALPKISPLDKIIVAFAGPLFSFGLAFCFAVLVWGLGKPETALSATTTIGYVEAGGPADEAGLLEGDRVISIDGANIRHFSSPVDSVIERVMFSRDETMDWVVERDGQELSFTVGYVKKPLNGSKRAPIRTVGVGPLEPAIVGAFLDGGTPAQSAGFKTGDIIKSVDGNPVFSYGHFGKLVRGSGGELAVEIMRGKEAVSLKLVPEKPTFDKPLEDGQKPEFMAGIIQRAPDDLTLTKPGPKPMVQLQDSLTMMYRMIGGLFSSKSDISPTHMSSAVGIGNIYYKMLSDPKYGWLMAIWFSVLLNVNLAVLNMLPFPVLDGGHITIALMEAVRRRPVNVRILEVHPSRLRGRPDGIHVVRDLF